MYSFISLTNKMIMKTHRGAHRSLEKEGKLKTKKERKGGTKTLSGINNRKTCAKLMLLNETPKRYGFSARAGKRVHQWIRSDQSDKPKGRNRREDERKAESKKKKADTIAGEKKPEIILVNLSSPRSLFVFCVCVLERIKRQRMTEFQQAVAVAVACCHRRCW